METLNYLESLPAELLFHEILSRLSFRELHEYYQVDRQSQRLLTSSAFWKIYLSYRLHYQIQQLVVFVSLEPKYFTIFRQIIEAATDLLDVISLHQAFINYAQLRFKRGVDYIRERASR